MMHDLVIHDALILDGLGGIPYRASLAVDAGKIVAIGEDVGAGAETIAADGLALMPGIIDSHTHYDAQVTWDALCDPSPALGVTTVLMGRSEEHTSELQSLMRISYAVFCLKTKNI